MSRWQRKDTGEPVSRTDIVEAFEATLGRPLTAEEYQQCLEELDRLEAEME